MLLFSLFSSLMLSALSFKSNLFPSVFCTSHSACSAAGCFRFSKEQKLGSIDTLTAFNNAYVLSVLPAPLLRNAAPSLGGGHPRWAPGEGNSGWFQPGDVVLRLVLSCRWRVVLQSVAIRCKLMLFDTTHRIHPLSSLHLSMIEIGCMSPVEPCSSDLFLVLGDYSPPSLVNKKTACKNKIESRHRHYEICTTNSFNRA